MVSDGSTMHDDGAVTTPEALQALYGEALPTAIVKETDRLTEPYAAFVEAAPFVVLATQGAKGIDITPRGDPAGFVVLEDAHTLLLPDRRGNNRLDSLRNILVDPRVGLLFLVPGVGETLRVAGRAEIRADAALRARFVVQGKEPTTVLRIHVEKVYYHCQKALIRSRLWDPAARVERSALPSIGTMLAAATPPGAIDAAAHDDAYAKRQTVLY